MVHTKNSVFIGSSGDFGLNELKNQAFLQTKLTYYSALAQNLKLPGPYEAFISECSSKQPCPDDVLEKHHITPRHAGGSDDPTNLIKLTIPDHILAHWLLWKQNDSENDRLAYAFRVSTSKERDELKRQLVMKNVEKYQAEGLFFYNSEFQREQGKKGGKKGGSASTAEQFQARQKVGLTYGKTTGQGNQSSLLKDFLSKYSIWKFDGCMDQKGVFKNNEKGECPLNCNSVEMFVLISPKESFISVVETLLTFAPGSIDLVQAKKGTMNKLVFNKKQQMYSWKIIDTLTRSEVEQGALAKLKCSQELLLENLLPE